MKNKIPQKLLKEINDYYQILYKVDKALEEMYSNIDYWNDKLSAKYPADYWGWSTQEVKEDKELSKLVAKLEYVVEQYRITVKDFRDDMQKLISRSELENRVIGFGGVLVFQNLCKRVQNLEKKFAKSRKFKELNLITPGNNFTSDMDYFYEQLDKKLETVGDRRRVLRKINFAEKK